MPALLRYFEKVKNYWIPSAALLISLGANAEVNKLTREEKSAGWILLFDGKSKQGWVDPRQKTPPGRLDYRGSLPQGDSEAAHSRGSVHPADIPEFRAGLRLAHLARRKQRGEVPRPGSFLRTAAPAEREIR